MSLTQRTEIRRCGKPYSTMEKALASKRGQSGRYTAEKCPDRSCRRWHLRPKPRQAAHPFPPKVAAQLDARDQCCQRCGSGRNLERHHRRLKGSGGSQDRAHAQCACNGVVLCQKCHGQVHRGNRIEAGAQGFIVSQSVDEPGSVSVMRFAAADGGATQYPTCDGGWSDTAPGLREAA